MMILSWWWTRGNIAPRRISWLFRKHVISFSPLWIFWNIFAWKAEKIMCRWFPLLASILLAFADLSQVLKKSRQHISSTTYIHRIGTCTLCNDMLIENISMFIGRWDYLHFHIDCVILSKVKKEIFESSWASWLINFKKRGYVAKWRQRQRHKSFFWLHMPTLRSQSCRIWNGNKFCSNRKGFLWEDGRELKMTQIHIDPP